MKLTLSSVCLTFATICTLNLQIFAGTLDDHSGLFDNVYTGQNELTSNATGSGGGGKLGNILNVISVMLNAINTTKLFSSDPPPPPPNGTTSMGGGQKFTKVHTKKKELGPNKAELETFEETFDGGSSENGEIDAMIFYNKAYKASQL
jgi:hypothetical protein